MSAPTPSPALAVGAHTAGPWEWWTSNSWKRLRLTDHGVSTNVLLPCVAPDGHPDLIVSDADMRLIAAAPDLLRALKMLETVWAAILADRHGGTPDEQREPSLNAARTAITKATTLEKTP